MSHLPIRRVGVIGAGVMGAGIAAHLANAGIATWLLDIVPPDLKDGEARTAPPAEGGGKAPPAEKNDRKARDRFAQGGLDRAVKNKPALFFHKGNARLVQIGNTEDDLEKLAGCDLVIEAVLERLDVKQALFARLEKVLGPTAIVASNTSGLCIADMMKGRSEGFRKNFLVMHFFNPVRYMKLLELVAGQDTDPAVMARARHFGEDVLGKGIVVCKDTPNFVGNRIGAYAMLKIIHLMLEEGLSPEDVDAITGEAMAHPKSASFRTADVVGLDTFVHVADNCYAALDPKTGARPDAARDTFKIPAYLRTMVEKKLLGDKTKGGFYKKVGKDIQTLDPKTLEYRAKTLDESVKKATKAASKQETPEDRVKTLVADPGKAGQFAWKVLAATLDYSARRIGEITDSLVAVDDAMRWGYNWELGPFEVWDALGFAAVVERMTQDGIDVPEPVRRMKASGATSFYRADGQVFDLAQGKYVAREVDPRTAGLTVLRRGGAPVLSNDGAEAWDLGDGVLGLTFKTKANSIDSDIIAMIPQAVERAERDFRGMVIANQGEHFCVGANLFLVVMAAGQGDWDGIRRMVGNLQAGMQRMKYASVPVVAAPYGMTLGGGLEICLASSAIQAAAETYSGQVEVAVGLVPGGAGTVNLLWRTLEGVPEGAQVNTLELVANVFKNIALAKVATSAEEAKQFGYFRRADGISFDKARLVTEAKQKVIGMATSGYHAPVPRSFTLPGDSGIATLRMMIDTLVAGGHASAHDALIATRLAEVLCGGRGGSARDVTEDEVLELEREAFVSLCGEPKSQERMQYMLMNNKPLRN
jgi:3-hydroxyacyl-CoA dehydrogenase